MKKHLATEKPKAFLYTDVMVFHGSTEVFLQGKWLKITPAFNKELCYKLQAEPLVFNGREEAIFQQFDKKKTPIHGVPRRIRLLPIFAL